MANRITSYEVFAFDLRGHGQSEHHPADVSPQAYCLDVVEVVKAMGHERVHLVGQSFGGHVAFLAAAWHPELVSSLVVVEADPDGPSPDVLDQVASWLRSWPRPFPDRLAALEFFGSSPSGSAWVEGLVEREGEYWPRFDTDVVLNRVGGSDDSELVGRLGADRPCPTWIVRADGGALSLELADKTATELPNASVVTIPGAGHDVHLDQPVRLSQVLMQRGDGA